MHSASEMTERYKNLIGWMQIIVTSTKPPSSTQEEFDFSDEAVRHLKTAVSLYRLNYFIEKTYVKQNVSILKIAASITKSRENAVQIEELRTSLSSKELQISHLKDIISQMSADFRRLGDYSHKMTRKSDVNCRFYVFKLRDSTVILI